MRQVLLVTAGLVLAVSIVVGMFALNQANQEQIELTSRLQSRSQVLADSLSESIEPSYNTYATNTMQRIIDRFVSSERLAGLGVFDSGASSIAASKDIPLPSDTFVATVMDSDQPLGEFVRRDGETYYTYVLPLHQEERVVGALAVVQNATYIDQSISAIWRDNLLRLFLQVALFAAAIFIIVRWVFFRSVTQLTASIQRAREGGDETAVYDAGFLQPLAGEITKVTRSLHQARRAASEEARMRHEKIDSPWTADRLREFIKAYVKDRPIYVVSNTEPYVSKGTKGKITWTVPAGGVVTALEPIMEACGGTWVAHGSGEADKLTADAEGKLRVPPEEPKYTLKRVYLTPKEVAGYYNGFSNEALWPLCHLAHVRPQFRKEDWMEYRKVNGLFAKALLEEIRHVEQPVILIQDYHLALVPALIKKSRPDADVAIFWHIPWPSASQFSICPQRRELLEGMLGADVIGFHTQQYCNNFIDTVASEIESRVDFENFSISRNEHRSFIRPFPISIAFPGIAETGDVSTEDITGKLGIRTPHLALGVDRLDYIKGIPERFRGVEFLLDTYPEYRGNFTLLQIASPTRASVEKYREYAEQVEAEAERINAKFAQGDWRPIRFEHRHYSHAELRQLYRQAEVCMVTSLHDGMNLVAKEYVAMRQEENGVLILSHFTGASRDMKGALLVNPYSAEDTAQALYTALTMPKTEQHRRMKALRQSVRDYNVYRWSAEFIKALLQLE